MGEGAQEETARLIINIRSLVTILVKRIPWIK